MKNQRSDQVAPLPVHLMSHICFYLKNPRVALSRDFFIYQTRQVFLRESVYFRKIQSRILKYLTRKTLFYNPLSDQEFNPHEYLTGENMSVEYRLKLIGYFLIKDKQFKLKKESKTFIGFFIDKPLYLEHIIPIVLHFPNIPNSSKQQFFETIIKFTQYYNSEITIQAMMGLKIGLQSLDKEYVIRGLKTLQHLINDNNYYVRKEAARSLCFVIGCLNYEMFTQVNDELELLSDNENIQVRRSVAKGLTYNLHTIKPPALSIRIRLLVELSFDSDWRVRKIVAKGLSQTIESLDDLGYKRLQSLCQDSSWFVRKEAAKQLNLTVNSLKSPESSKGYSLLLSLSQDKNKTVRKSTNVHLNRLKIHPDKSQSTVGLCESSKKEIALIIQRFNKFSSSVTTETLAQLCSRGHQNFSKEEEVGLKLAFYSMESPKLFKIAQSLINWSQHSQSNVQILSLKVLPFSLKRLSQSMLIEAVESMVAIVQKQDPRICQEALTCSENIIDRLDFNSLLIKLESFYLWSKSPKWQIRKIAAKGISQAIKSLDPEKRNRALKTLSNNLANDSESEVVVMAINGLIQNIKFLDQESLENLTNLKKSKNWGGNYEVVYGLSKGLGEIDPSLTSKGRDILHAWRKAEDEGVRYLVVKGLLDGRNVLANDLKLIKSFSKDNSEIVRLVVAKGLSQIIIKLNVFQFKDVLTILKPMCQDNCWKIRKAAATGVSLIAEHLDETNLTKLLKGVTEFKEEIQKIIYNKISFLWLKDDFRERVLKNSLKPVVFQQSIQKQAQDESPMEINELLNKFEKMQVNR